LQENQEYRIVVVGVKETMNVTDSTTALKDLFNDHKYTDGFALLKQGQHTNNYNNEYVGYATYNIDSEIIYKAEYEKAEGTNNISTPLYSEQTIESFKKYFKI